MNLDYDNIDAHWMDALDLVKRESDDPDTQVASILTDAKGCFVSRGANRMPHGVKKKSVRLQRPEKYNWIIHAEQFALASRAKPVVGGTLYCSVYPCSECMAELIVAGVRRVVSPHRLEPFSEDMTTWHKSQWVAEQMAREAGLEMISWES